ncbi:MAG: hypothetical protein KAS87_03015, partial [Candidatus Omnitrophica bacterium]|nr:hypothetical protein [Candidatus Omnitrophota bacterium]
VMESLIKCGASDCFNLPRAQLMVDLGGSLQRANRLQKDKTVGQLSFFSNLSQQKSQQEEKVKPIKEWPHNQLLAFEKELLGFYFSGHPLTQYEEVLKKYSISVAQLNRYNESENVLMGGIITKIKPIVTKRGDRMAFLNLETSDGMVEIIIFPKVFNKVNNYVKIDAPVFVDGKVNLKDSEHKIIAENIISIHQVYQKYTDSISLRLEIDADKTLLERTKSILFVHRGETPVYLILSSPQRKWTIRSSLTVQPKRELFLELEQLLGERKVDVEIRSDRDFRK